MASTPALAGAVKLTGLAVAATAGKGGTKADLWRV